MVAETEWQAVQAMRRLAAGATWSPGRKLPDGVPIAELVMRAETQDTTILERGGGAAPDAKRRLEATFTRPYQAHGSIGPSCAVAHQDGDVLTVWTHTQGVYPDRAAIAEMLRVPPGKVRCHPCRRVGLLRP